MKRVSGQGRQIGRRCVGSRTLGVAAGLWMASVAPGCGDSGEQTTGATTGGETESGTASETETGTETGAGTTGDETPEPEPVLVEWDDGALELILWRGDDVLLRFPGDGLSLGEVDAIVDDSSYDPVFSEPTRWQTVIGAGANTGDPAGEVVVDVALTYSDGAAARLVVRESAPGSFRAVLSPEPGESQPVLAFYRLSPVVDAGEGFYGLGEYFDAPEHRGRVRQLQLELDTALESGYNEAHVPVPFITGTRGWGLYVASDHPAVFDVAASAPDRVAATFGTGPATPDGLEFHLFAADHPLDVTRHYYEVTGYPRRPAPWALGPWVWRDENDDQAQVEADVATIRALDLATSAIWIDRPYASAVNTFDFLGTQFPDPEAMIATVRGLGFRVALWHAPYVDADDPAAAELRAAAEDGGYFPPQTGLLTSSWNEPVDLTNPAAYAWWRGLIELYTSMGVEGFKLDYAEDVTVGIGGARTKWAFANGSSERTMHKHYTRLYHQVYDDALAPDGGFMLARAGAAGDQVTASVIWPGDLDANMARHREQVSDGDDIYNAVGGLPAAVVAGLSLGPSGFPLFASDTGGYRHSPPDRETFTRWFEHTALTPVMQIGTSSNDVAWEFTPDNGFDEDMLAWYREYTRLHLRLFPYLWTHVHRLRLDGRPIVRALGLAHPELGVHPPDIYLLGDALLVAPVVDYGARAREVVFPPGLWIEWFTGQVYDGGAQGSAATVDAPLERLPLFLAAGGVVPMLRPTIDTLAPATDDAVDSYADDPGPLHAAVFPAGSSSFTVFDGTKMSQTTGESTIELELTPGDTFSQGVVFSLRGIAAAPADVAGPDGPLPEIASLDSLLATVTGWYFEPGRGGVLHVKLPGGVQAATVTR